jgi:uncharacterized membrane protein (Fun14 family)
MKLKQLITGILITSLLLTSEEGFSQLDTSALSATINRYKDKLGKLLDCYIVTLLNCSFL